MKQGKNIILIGYMGSGKTTLGKRAAKAVKYQFADTDAIIEQEENCSISELFQTKGEPYFRQRETEVLQQLLAENEKRVIATGGGLPMKEENVELLHRLGTIVFLQAGLETLVERLSNDTKRPLLAGENPRENIKRMLEIREPVYQAAADLMIETDELTMYEIIHEIEKLVQRETKNKWWYRKKAKK